MQKILDLDWNGVNGVSNNVGRGVVSKHFYLWLKGQRQVICKDAEKSWAQQGTLGRPEVNPIVREIVPLIDTNWWRFFQVINNPVQRVTT